MMRIIAGLPRHTDGNWRSIRYKLGQEESLPQRLCSRRQLDAHIIRTQDQGSTFLAIWGTTHTLDDPECVLPGDAGKVGVLRFTLWTLAVSEGGQCSPASLPFLLVFLAYTVSWCAFRPKMKPSTRERRAGQRSCGVVFILPGLRNVFLWLCCLRQARLRDTQLLFSFVHMEFVTSFLARCWALYYKLVSFLTGALLSESESVH